MGGRWEKTGDGEGEERGEKTGDGSCAASGPCAGDTEARNGDNPAVGSPVGFELSWSSHRRPHQARVPEFRVEKTGARL